MLVTVSQRSEFLRSRNEFRDCLDRRFVEFLTCANLTVVPVPNALVSGSDGANVIANWLTRLSPNFIVLSGGGDVGDDILRDKTEKYLIAFAERRQLPLLGICRGMQTLCLQHDCKLEKAFGHVRSRHQLVGEISHEVNSYHNFSIDSCPSDFRIIARSEDGCIEAVRHKFLPWEGWMWHPERERKPNPVDLERLQNLISAATD